MEQATFTSFADLLYENDLEYTKSVSFDFDDDEDEWDDDDDDDDD